METFVIEKAQTPNGMDIQLENWHDRYDFMAKNSTIGFYPMCHNSIHGKFWDYPERGKTFRASLRFSNEQFARNAFELLKNGEKTFMHYLEFYEENVISKNDFINAVTV